MAVPGTDALHRTPPRTDRPAATSPWYLGATTVAALPWLVRLHIVTAGIDILVVIVAAVFPRADFPLHRVAIPVAVAAGCHLAAAMWLARSREVPAALAVTGLIVDVLLLTGLLELTGGPFNPFSVVYAAQVALAALTVGRAAGWLTAGVASLGYGLLFYWHTHELAVGHHRLNDFPTHLFTLWVAIAATVELAMFFIVQASNTVAAHERELEAMRARAVRSERLVSLTTLAAGAAHELSTPLATIALAARELEHAAEAQAGPATPSFVEDARLIRSEVDRCRTILDQMSGRAGGAAADSAEAVDIHDVLADVSARLPASRAARLDTTVEADLPALFVPRAGLVQVIGSLVNNAFDASQDDVPVHLAARSTGTRRDTIVVSVRDRGAGLTPDTLDRAGEPFYTTKQPGHGLGLGLFLARIFAERFGGSLTLTSGDGTIAALELPAAGASPVPPDRPS